jgi:hypothetical protein
MPASKIPASADVVERKPQTCDNLIVDRHIVAVIPPVSRTASRPGCETTVTFLGAPK